MKNLIYVILVLVLFASCARKFDFKNAYKFKTIKYTSKKDSAANEIQPLASMGDKKPLSTQPNYLDQIDKRIKQLELVELEGSESKKRAIAKDYIKSLSKEDKKAIRKDIRSTIKEVKKNYKKDRKALKDTKQDASKNWLAIAGLITGGLAGIGLLIGSGLIFLSIPGLIFSIMGLKSEKKTAAIIGLALNALAFLIIILAVIIIASLLSSV